MPRGFHVQKIASDKDIVTMCPFHHNNMIFLTVNLCYVVVINIQVLLYPLRNLKHMKQTRVQQYILMSTY